MYGIFISLRRTHTYSAFTGNAACVTVLQLSCLHKVRHKKKVTAIALPMRSGYQT